MISDLSGEERLELSDGLLEPRTRFVAVRHEQGAGLAADVRCRLRGRAERAKIHTEFHESVDIVDPKRSARISLGHKAEPMDPEG